MILCLARKMLKINFLKSTYTNVHKRGVEVLNIFICHQNLILKIFRANKLFLLFLKANEKMASLFVGNGKTHKILKVEKFSVIWMRRSKPVKVNQRHELLFWKEKSLKIACVLFLLLHLVLFPSKNKNKNQTWRSVARCAFF